MREPCHSQGNSYYPPGPQTVRTVVLGASKSNKEPQTNTQGKKLGARDVLKGIVLACHAGRQLRARVARKGASASSSLSPACMLSEEVCLGPGELFLHPFSFWEGSTFPVNVPAKRRMLWLHMASRGCCLSNSAFVIVQPSL